MDIELLRTFLQVARTGRFRVAAEQLCLTQSAVSARIKLLEGEMGIRLFDRNKHGVALTYAGTRLVSHAETILSDWRRCCQEVILPSDAGAMLAVGSVDSVWTMYLGKWLALTHQAAPELVIKAEISSTDVLVRQLLEGTLDLIVVFETPQLPQVISVPLVTIPMVMVSSRRKQTAAQAMAGRYVFVDWSPVFSTLHLQHFPGEQSNKVQTTSGKIALDLVLAMGGAAYFPQPMVRGHLTKRQLFEVADAPRILRPIYALHLVQRGQDGPLTRAIALLRDILQEDS
ncbi:MAG: LysR family transcriptional regulator [Nitrospirota bacterium]|jgi:DNA-binding transcriptional LysR family regulator